MSDEPEDYDLFEEELAVSSQEAGGDGSITAIPTLLHYQKRYAYSISDNDQKAVRLFKEYETLEKVRRLQAELQWVASGQVYSQTLDSVIGKKRRSKYKTYAEWAKLMLLWLAQAKR